MNEKNFITKVPEESKLNKSFADNEGMKKEKKEDEENVIKEHYKKLEEYRDLLGNVEKDLKTEFPERGINDTKERDFITEFDRNVYNQLKSEQQRLQDDIENTKQEIKKVESEMERRKELIETNREN